MKTILGVFLDKESADLAIQSLATLGFKAENISVVRNNEVKSVGEGIVVGIPGLGGLLITGPLAEAGAAAVGEMTRTYEVRIKEGGILLAVPAETTVDESRVVSVFRDQGADQVKAV